MHDPGDRTEFLEQGIDAVLREGEAALDRLCAARPEFAEPLRRKVASLRQLRLLSPPTATAEHPQSLGPYRILRLLGRGGMGAVYVAEQTPLHRRVALKLIRPEQLYFPGARERFEREIDAIARLQLPGVVPILDVGAAGGVPYYAMELLPGVDLARLLRGLSARRDASVADVLAEYGEDRDAPREAGSSLFEGGHARIAARVALRLARTLARVHEHGIVHRDVKPSNVVVDAEGRVTLVDFGLAHLVDADELTRSGAMLGSLPYMAPEQVRGERAAVGAHTDIYGLGVTLHELVYLQPAFGGDDQVRLASSILAGRSPRSDGARDLETIIACATDPDPARRYRSADAMADDLLRFLDYRPLETRRTGLALRAVRWGQRNRVLAIGLLALFVLAVALPTAIAVERSARAAELQREFERYELTINGVVDVLGRATRMVAEVGTAEGGELDGEARAVMTSVADFYADLRRLDPTRTRLRNALLTALHTEVELRSLLGDYSAALVRSDEVLAATAAMPATAGRRYELRQLRIRCFKELGDLAAADREYEAAIAELEGVEVTGEAQRLQVARGAHLRAILASRRLSPDQVRWGAAALQQMEAVCRDFPDNLEAIAYRAKSQRLLAQMYGTAGDLDRDFELLHAARDGVVAALASHPHDRMLKIELAITEQVLGQELRASARHAEALPHLRAAERLRREFHTVWPSRPLVTLDLVDTLADVGSSCNIVGELGAAADALGEAHELLDGLLQRGGGERIERQQAQVCMELASNLRRRHGVSDRSHALNAEAVRIIEAVLQRHDEPPLEYYGERAVALVSLAQSFLGRGEYDAALEVALRSRADMRRFVTPESAQHPLMRRQLGQVCLMACYLAARGERLPLVRELLREAHELIEVGADDVAFLTDLLGEERARLLLAELDR